MERYRKIKQIGTGSFGSAWLVESAVSGRKYALKELGVSIMSEQDRQLALNEAKILSQLKHRSIVRYKEAFVAEGKLCIAMEFAEKGDLYSRIKERNGLHFPETQVLDWFTQLCFALKYIHGQNILHRDLKTQNIFLAKDDVIKLGDFGIARMLNSTLDHAQTTVGTPYYLSPEICQRKPYNHKSDMWSLGCVLYEMTTLQHAFNASNFSALVIKILQGQYPPIPPFYGPLLEDLVSVLLRRNPEERPSAKQLLHVPAMQLYVGKFLLSERNRGDSVASISSDVSTRSVQESSPISGPANVLTNRSNCKETNSDLQSAVALDPEKRCKENGSERKSSCTIERRRSSDNRTGSKDLQFRENVPYNPLSKSGKHSLAHARKCRNSSVPVSRAMQKKIHNSGAQSRICSEAEDDVFAENQPTVIHMNRQESSCALIVNGAKGTAKNCKVSSVPRKRGNESSLADQSKDAGDVHVRRRHLSVLTVFNRSCWQTEQKQRRLTSRSMLGSKDQENANAMNVFRNVVTKQQALSSAMKQTHCSKVDRKPISNPGTQTTGSEREIRKRTYTVSHGRRPSEFEIPDVDKGRQQKERKTAYVPYDNDRVRSTRSHSLSIMKSSKPSSSDKKFPPRENSNDVNERKEADNLEMEKRESLRACPHGSLKIASTKRKDNRISAPLCKFTFCGRTLVLDNVTNGDSAYSHMEALRMHLETSLGTRLFTDVYHYITETSCEKYDELWEKVLHILGEHNMKYYPVILQLVACEAFYFQQNSQCR